jgi:nitroreductase
VARTAEVRGVTVDSLAKFRAMIAGSIGRARTEGTLDGWQTHQIYIALGLFMAAAALLGVDTCPMEGIEPARYDEILGLGGTGYATVVACAAGYRHAEDKYAATPKVRFCADDVLVRV